MYSTYEMRHALHLLPKMSLPSIYDQDIQREIFARKACQVGV
jgi:hypothetical protein